MTAIFGLVARKHIPGGAGNNTRSVAARARSVAGRRGE